MGYQSAQSLAAGQHGVVSRTQLLDAGVAGQTIKHWVATARLHPVHRGVYAIGRPDLSQLGGWMAAVLACGPRAAISHRSAAALWEIVTRDARLPHVSILEAPVRRRPGITVHRRSIPVQEATTHRGVPVTTPMRTLVDLARTRPAAVLERAVNEADRLDLIDPERLRGFLDGLAGHPGVRPLRTLLDRRTFTVTDSRLEQLFLPIARRARLAKPRTQAEVNGFRVDFFWPGLGLVVETDGLRYHRTPAQQARDRLRDQTHTAAGLTVLRFTHAQVRYEPAEVLRILAATAARLRG
jgi:very-short-patch-repair endonuclease